MNLATDLNKINVDEVLHDLVKIRRKLEVIEGISYDAWLIADTLIAQEIESIRRRTYVLSND